jgi:hypothetical protein
MNKSEKERKVLAERVHNRKTEVKRSVVTGDVDVSSISDKKSINEDLEWIKRVSGI